MLMKLMVDEKTVLAVDDLDQETLAALLIPFVNHVALWAAAHGHEMQGHEGQESLQAALRKAQD